MNDYNSIHAIKCKTKVAILMAAYNGSKYIAEQIESIIDQDYGDWTLYCLLYTSPSPRD